MEDPISSAMEWQEAWKQGDARVAGFHASRAWEVPLGALSTPRPLDMTAIEEWKAFLRPHAGDHDLSPLDLLTNPQVMLVVAGQQAGALLGPLYTLYKALAAKKWAEELSQRHGRPCIPVFWIASDDHDLAEVASAAWLDSDDQLRSQSIADPVSGGSRSVSSEVIDPAAMQAFLEEFLQSTRETEFRAPLLAAMEQALSTGNFEGQFLSLFCRLLLPMGIFPIAPRLGFLRRAAVPLIRREIDTAGSSSMAAVETGRHIAELGMAPPLHREGNELNFFVEVQGLRCRVEKRGDRFVAIAPGSRTEAANWSQSQLLELLEESPAAFSPNALLRPVVQDAALNTIVYIGGPTELVYHCQIAGLYRHFDVPRPAVFPRPNVILLEPRHTRAMEKLGLTRDDLLRYCSHDSLEKLLVSRASSGDAADILPSARRELEGVLAGLTSQLAREGRDTGVEKAMEKLRQSLDMGLTKLEERHTAFLANRDSNLAGARQKLLRGLFPGGAPQERQISVIAPLLVNHGEGGIHRIHDLLDTRAPGFQVIAL